MPSLLAHHRVLVYDLEVHNRGEGQLTLAIFQSRYLQIL